MEDVNLKYAALLSLTIHGRDLMNNTNVHVILRRRREHVLGLFH